jgi:hypothetical protein
VSLLYFIIAGTLAFEKRLWNDELFTFYIAQRPSFHEVWKALLTGAEQLPPLFFVITRAFIGVFGAGRLSLRLPEMLGFWLMSVSLFYVVGRRSSAVYGLVAMVFPMLTEAFSYAFEARPYGLVLGFSGLALLCWQNAAEGRRIALSHVCLLLSLAAAVSCHYYAVLTLVPLAIGECVRTVVRRRLDVWMWLALAGGLLPLALFLPLIKAARAHAGTFWAKASWMSWFPFYRDLLGTQMLTLGSNTPGRIAPAVLALLVIPIITALYLSLRSSERASLQHVSRVFVPHEIAAIIGFIFIPIFAVVLAKTVTGAFTDRYVLSAIVGLTVLLALSCFVITHRSGSAGLSICTVMLVLFTREGLGEYRQCIEDRATRIELYDFLKAHDNGPLPLVIDGPHLFFELSHQAAERRDRGSFIFVADTSLALRYTGTDDVERGLLALRHWAPLDVHDFHQFCQAHQEFLIYSSESAAFSWVTHELVKERWRLTVVAEKEGSFLFRVSRRVG